MVNMKRCRLWQKPNGTAVQLYIRQKYVNKLSKVRNFLTFSCGNLARVLAEVASNPGLRRELNARVPPVIWEAAQDALRRTPAGKAADAAYGVLEKLRPKR